MQVQTLPLPNPDDWVTVAGAARIIGRTKRQVTRYVADERLTSYRIYGAKDLYTERLIWRADAEAFRDALKHVERPGVVERVKREAQRGEERRR